MSLANDDGSDDDDGDDDDGIGGSEDQGSSQRDMRVVVRCIKK